MKEFTFFNKPEKITLKLNLSDVQKISNWLDELNDFRQKIPEHYQIDRINLPKEMSLLLKEIYNVNK
jgi:hypothetical protein